MAELHAGHPRADQFEHCQQVAELLEEALKLEGIHWPDNYEMILAALGHDLYEDVRPKPVNRVSEFGTRVDALISALTEDKKHGVSEFVERVATGPEEAILIKLCDGISNYGGLVAKDKLRDHPGGTLRKIVEEKMEPMFSRLEDREFSRYPNAGNLLAKDLETKRRQFWTYAKRVL